MSSRPGCQVLHVTCCEPTVTMPSVRSVTSCVTKCNASKHYTSLRCEDSLTHWHQLTSQGNTFLQPNAFESITFNAKVMRSLLQRNVCSFKEIPVSVPGYQNGVTQYHNVSYWYSVPSLRLKRSLKRILESLHFSDSFKRQSRKDFWKQNRVSTKTCFYAMLQSLSWPWPWGTEESDRICPAV